MTTQPRGAPAQPTELCLESGQDLGAIHTLTNPSHLTALTLRNWSKSDLSPLAGLAQLTMLDLSNCSQVSDLSSLAGLAELTKLELFRCTQISDLSPLADLTQLTELDLSHCPQVRDLSPLAGLTQLTRLYLIGNGRRLRAGRLRVLAGLPQLTIVR
jgi:internalin A